MKIKIVTVLFLLITGMGKIYAQTELWGMTQFGGVDGIGSIFKIKPDGTDYTHCYDFPTDYPGRNPLYTTPIQATDGKLYGVTAGGGACGEGVIFSYDTSSSIYTRLYDFDDYNGSYSNGSLIQANNGLLYGLTAGGGLYGRGVLFSFDIITSTYTKLFDFDNTNSGREPLGTLMQATNGKLYGTANSGGAYNNGTLFTFDPATNAFFKEFDFNTSIGANPHGRLVEAGNGKIFGTMSNGGLYGVGGIFSFDATTHILTTIVDMQCTGAPVCYYGNGGCLLYGSDGFLYGVTGGGTLASNFGGVFFRIDTTGANLTALFLFDGNVNAESPNEGIIQASDGKIYGTATYSLNSYGAIFQYDIPSGNMAFLHNFQQDENGTSPEGGLIESGAGNFFGLTRYAGSMYGGVLYRFQTLSNTYTKPFGFEENNTGGLPTGKLTLASNGKLYGTTYRGGTYSGGVIFKVDTSNYQITKVYDFQDTISGRAPTGYLTKGNNGKLYGISRSFGLYHGAIFSIDPATDSVEAYFTYEPVSNYSTLLLANDSNFYGMGGWNNGGSIFRFNPDSNTFSRIFLFGDTINFTDTATGSWPQSGLIQASNGKLYGMTWDGGSNSAGVIFSYDLPGNLFTKLYDFDGINGYGPYGYLTEAPNGKLYGVTFSGGQSDDGTLFCIDTATNVFTKLVDFQDTIYAHAPGGSLLLASDGKLYGMTNQYGAEDYGTIFSYDIVNNIYTKLRDFSCQNGDGIYPNSTFIELPVTSPNGIGFAPNISVTTSLMISPNPATDNITVHATALKGKNAVIKITDITGLEIIKKGKIIVSNETFNLSVQTKNLSSGIYFVTLQTEKENLVRKFVKE